MLHAEPAMIAKATPLGVVKIDSRGSYRRRRLLCLKCYAPRIANNGIKASPLDAVKIDSSGSYERRRLLGLKRYAPRTTRAKASPLCVFITPVHTGGGDCLA